MTIDRLQAVHALRDMLAEGHRVEWKGGEKIGPNPFTTEAAQTSPLGSPGLSGVSGSATD